MKCDCGDPSQCWEPCGELGKSEGHAVKSSLTLPEGSIRIYIDDLEIKGEIDMKTPCEQKGYKVGDRFEVIDGIGGIFDNGSVIELYRDDGSTSPLFKLISGYCGYYHCDGKSGAYLFLDKVKKIEDTAQVTIKMERGMFFDTKYMSGDQIRELCEKAESQGFSYFYSGGIDEILRSECRYIFLDEDKDILRDYDDPEEMFDSSLVSGDMTVREVDWKLSVKTEVGNEEPFKLLVGDFLDLREHTVTLDLIQKIADAAQQQGYGLCEGVDQLYYYTKDNFMDGVLIQNNGLCSRDDHFDDGHSQFKRKVTLDQWLGSVDNVSKDDNEEEQSMFKLELNDFIDFRSENVTQKLIDKVCEVIVANGYELYESAEEMYYSLVDNAYEGIRIHPEDGDAYTVMSEQYHGFNRVLSVSEVLGDNPDEDSEIDHDELLHTIVVLSLAAGNTNSEKITKLVEELSEKVAKKFL